MSDDYVFQLSVSIPHSGSDYAKADMVNIRGRNPDEFSRALAAFDQHMSQQCAEIGQRLRAVALVGGEMGGTYVGQSENPQNAAQSAPSAPVDPWQGQPASGPQNGYQGQAPQGDPWQGQSQGGYQQQQQQQQQQQPAQGVPTSPPPHVGPPPSCSHGVKKFLAKPYKSGKPGYWMGWACPAQRNDPSQHELEFIRQN